MRKEDLVSVITLIITAALLNFYPILFNNQQTLEEIEQHHKINMETPLNTESRINSILLKGASGYSCILPPSETNKKYFNLGETIYTGSSDMLQFICEYLKRRNLVNEIIPNSRKLMKRLIYEAHLLEMFDLRDKVIRKYVSPFVAIDMVGYPQKKKEFIIRNILIRKAITNFYNTKGPSFTNTLPTKIRAALFDIRKELSNTAFFIFINISNERTLRGISKEIVDLLPKYLFEIANSCELENIMKEQFTELLFYLLQNIGNRELVQSGMALTSLPKIALFIQHRRNLFNNYENCFTNFSVRPMIGCIGFIKNMSGSLSASIIRQLYSDSELAAFTELQYDNLGELKDHFDKILLRTLHHILNSF
ncbi:predicted protein [Naegleria gruberi]|uniref:Predicted protein n=1 Tax=Naegleria gruberi TaxID=5762 RepID=D2VWK8_NAEGR|nr:uncharacterized protein NAEGRDRAFT_73415 [Naegleria gruberi]EFC38859.1 predicted protein [Naegleria gruberi]|eukprot:XP_002671603.1 predicted protein [Naegleria gruberi strain NEG-M]